MPFCPTNGSDWTEVWLPDQGINRCFYDSLTSGLTFLTVVLLVTLQCKRLAVPLQPDPEEEDWKRLKEKKKKQDEERRRLKTSQKNRDRDDEKQKEDEQQRAWDRREWKVKEMEMSERRTKKLKAERERLKRLPGSCVYGLQCAVVFFMALEPVIHMILQDVYIQEDGLSGFNVLSMLFLFSSYLPALYLLRDERGALVSLGGARRLLGVASLAIWALSVLRESLTAVSWASQQGWWWRLHSGPDFVDFGFWVFRLTCSSFVLVTCIWVKAKVRVTEVRRVKDGGEESVPLQDFGADGKDDLKKKKEKKDKEGSTWSNLGRKFRIIGPMVWPKGSRPLQFLVFLSVLLLIAGRVVLVFVPIYSKKIVNSLTDEQNVEFPWQLILMYSMLLYLKGAGSGGGLVQQIRGALWIRVQQYTSLRMNLRVFRHLHSLSLSWHLQRKTGEVLRVVEQGTASMNTVLNQSLFQIFPTLVDSLIAIVYFVTVFNYLFGLIVFACIVAYLVLTLVIMEWRTKIRREMIRLDKEAKAKAVDSLLNFETVKYYGATEYEIKNYSSALEGYVKAEWKSHMMFVAWQAIQNTLTTIGYLAGLLLCAWAIYHAIGDVKLTVGDYVLMGSYLGQLFGPLNSLGGYYRILQRSFIDMEHMFELLELDEDVQDEPDAKELAIGEGRIEFKKVNFFYDPSRPILKDISFLVLPGQTVALVGHTGSGKSTVIRLLFRFYDVNSGSITIDGQNIAMVTQNSLRNSIGVVPQDTVLFNRDIQYNIQYGRFNASLAEVKKAAAAADIHNRILHFPHEYETVVGERGLKLSGGEKQRVAIARTLLKAPAIVLLDEATSALDTTTERNIQASLARVCEGRTTVIIAHRLSTVVHADQILVMHEGRIAERGTHDELLCRRGNYANMWQQQLRGLGQDSGSVGSDYNYSSEEGGGGGRDAARDNS